MPLSKIQTAVLRLLAAHRDPESYSVDIDIFHDREERVATAAEQDAALLEGHGYSLKWIRRDPSIYTVLVKSGGEATKLEWVADGDFRFFPTIRDEIFGYILHPVDLAANKVMAAADRREAAVEKSPGFTPERLIAEIRRNTDYPAAEWRALVTSEVLDPNEIVGRRRPESLENYQIHTGQKRGHWPTSAEITAAMIDLYKNPPKRSP